MPSDASPAGAEHVLARSEPAWRYLLAITTVGLLVVVAAPWADTASRISAPAFVGALAAAALSGATARWAARGRTLTARTVFRVITLDACHVERVEESRGLAVITLDGQALTLTGEHQAIGAWLARRRTGRQAARLRAWVSEQSSAPGLTADGPRTRVRWSTVGAMALSALLTPCVAVLMEAVR